MTAAPDRADELARTFPSRRVLQVIDTLQPGGAERVLVSLANALSGQGHRVVVCCTRSGGPLIDDLVPGVDVCVLARERRWGRAALSELGRLVRRERIDVVHSHLRHTMQMVSLCKAARMVTVPHVFHDHYGEVHRDLSAAWTLRVAVRMGVDAYIGVDAELCRWATRRLRVPAERVSLLRNGIDVARFESALPLDVRRSFDLSGCDFVFAMLTNVRPQKDHVTMLHALAKLRSAPRIGVVVAGSVDSDVTYFESCQSLAHDLGVDARVRFVGPRSDVASLLASCDGALLSSVSESGPLAVLEYMAAGVPFVITNVGEITRQIASSEAGYVVPPRDVQALAGAMARLARLPAEERAAMGRRGRAGVVDFRHEQQVPNLLSIYESLLT